MHENVARLARSFEEQDADLAGGNPIRFEGYDEQLGWARTSQASARPACGAGRRSKEQRARWSSETSPSSAVRWALWSVRRSRAPSTRPGRASCLWSSCALPGARACRRVWSPSSRWVKTAEAQRRHAAAGGGQVAFLTSPTTGGVYASFASRSDVILAEPRATIGFAGPRVVEELTGSEPPTDVHTAEFAFEQGLIDALVPPDEAAPTIARVLRGLTSSSGSGKRVAPRTAPLSPSGLSAWERLQLARDPLRPKAPAMLDLLLTDAFELHGDRLGTNESSVVVRLGALAPTGRRVMAIGQDASGDGRIRPGGYRKAIRAVRMAAKLGLPVVTLIDTRGADPLPDSEAAGVASAVAWTFARPPPSPW